MRYLLLIHGDESAWNELPPEERAAARAEVMPQWMALFEWLEQHHPGTEGRELDEAATAKTVRVRDGETLVTDGPFAETKEQLGGFFVLDCDSLDEAIEAASRIPSARRGSVEVRAVAQP